MSRWNPLDRALRSRRSPYSRTLSLHDYILRAYLPYFATNHFDTDDDVDLILDSWLRSNSSILDPSRNFPLRERDFRKALYHILDAIDYAENYGESTTEVSRRLIMDLEEDWYDDLRYGGNQCQRRFRALAELSTASQSLPVGSLLRIFFLGWVHEIAEEEDTVSLAAWCWGVSRAYMNVRDKEECLRAVVALRPDVFDELSGRGASWMPRQLLNPPASVSWPRRRRDAGRIWWDDQNNNRTRRLIEDQEVLDRLANRDRTKLVRLRLRSPSPVRRIRSSDLGIPARLGIEGKYERNMRERSLSPIRLLRIKDRSDP